MTEHGQEFESIEKKLAWLTSSDHFFAFPNQTREFPGDPAASGNINFLSEYPDFFVLNTDKTHMIRTFESMFRLNPETKQIELTIPLDAVVNLMKAVRDEIRTFISRMEAKVALLEKYKDRLTRDKKKEHLAGYLQHAKDLVKWERMARIFIEEVTDIVAELDSAERAPVQAEGDEYKVVLAEINRVRERFARIQPELLSELGEVPEE